MAGFFSAPSKVPLLKYPQAAPPWRGTLSRSERHAAGDAVLGEWRGEWLAASVVALLPDGGCEVSWHSDGTRTLLAPSQLQCADALPPPPAVARARL